MEDSRMEDTRTQDIQTGDTRAATRAVTEVLLESNRVAGVRIVIQRSQSLVAIVHLGEITTAIPEKAVIGHIDQKIVAVDHRVVRRQWRKLKSRHEAMDLPQINTEEDEAELRCLMLDHLWSSTEVDGAGLRYLM